MIITDIARNISSTFWSPSVWLPPNTTWDDIAPTPENRFADYRHLLYPLPMALMLLVLRYALERYVRPKLQIFTHFSTSELRLRLLGAFPWIPTVCQDSHVLGSRILAGDGWSRALEVRSCIFLSSIASSQVPYTAVI